MDRHLETAIADLHAARLHLQGALVAVHKAVAAGEVAGRKAVAAGEVAGRKAVAAGEEAAGSNLRVIDAEFRGTAEEAAVFGVLLDQILTGGGRGASARRRAGT